jgi:hypothetical protein
MFSRRFLPTCRPSCTLAGPLRRQPGLKPRNLLTETTTPTGHEAKPAWRPRLSQAIRPKQPQPHSPVWSALSYHSLVVNVPPAHNAPTFGASAFSSGRLDALPSHAFCIVTGFASLPPAPILVKSAVWPCSTHHILLSAILPSLSPGCPTSHQTQAFNLPLPLSPVKSTFP